MEIEDDVKEIKTMVKDIFKVLNGNGSTGLVTKTALNESSVKRLWYFGGVIFVSIIGIAFFVLKGAL